MSGSASVLSALTCANGYYVYIPTGSSITSAICAAAPSNALTYGLFTTGGVSFINSLTCVAGYFVA